MEILPRCLGGAAENMAQDLLLLEAYPRPDAVRFRTYGWNQPAYTFGVSQRWTEWRAATPNSCTLIRRPTGGGLVSHLEDWTFALVVPIHHPLVALEALASYGQVLAALERALTGLGQPVVGVAAPQGPRAYRAPEVCAQRSEPYDLVRRDDGRKVAGAAQKRTRQGLLLQGYVDRTVLPECNWTKLETDFASNLADTLRSPLTKTETPQYPAAVAAETLHRFASEAWNQRI